MVLAHCMCLKTLVNFKIYERAYHGSKFSGEWLRDLDFKINVKDILTISFKVWGIKKRTKIATPTIKTT